jgi:hypothetical protein
MDILISILKQSCDERPSSWTLRDIVASRVAWATGIGCCCLFAACVLNSTLGFAVGSITALFGVVFLALPCVLHWQLRIHKPTASESHDVGIAKAFRSFLAWLRQPDRHPRAIADRVSRKCSESN